MKTVKVELHTHTKYSYDTDLNFEEIINVCNKNNIEVLAVTDHNEIEGAIRLSKLAPFRVIVGEEILTKQGEIVGLFLKKYIRPGLSVEKTINEIRKQKGLVYLPHPFDKTTRKTAITKQALEKILANIDIIETHNGRTLFNDDNKKALFFTKKSKKISAVGSDAHTIFEFGRNFQQIKDFKNSEEFLVNLKRGKLTKSKVIPWVFLITKLVRFIKKNFKDSSESKLLANNVSCDLCGSLKYKILYKSTGKFKKSYYISDDSYGSHEQIVKCIDCGLVFCYPRKSKKAILDRYSSFVDYKYEKEREARKINQQSILTTIEDLIKRKGRLLDVGAATGAFLEIARNSKWKINGLEPSRWAISYARDKYKIKISQGIINNAKFKKSSFDAITFIDVIEHVDSPRELLLFAKKFIKNDGVIVLITPNFGSMVARILRERWWHVRPDHLFYFDNSTLKLLIESLGFEVVKIKKPAWNFSYNYWVSRFKNKLPTLYRMLNFLEKIKILNIVTKRNFSINFFDSTEIYLKLRNND